MSSKKQLKARIDRLKAALKKAETESRLLHSDLLVEREKLSYRVMFAESEVRTLTSELMRMHRDARDKRTETELPVVSPNPPAPRVAKHEGNGAAASEAS